jgi:hypothetical protein
VVGVLENPAPEGPRVRDDDPNLHRLGSLTGLDSPE